MHIIKITKQKLKKMYVNLGLSQYEIAAVYKCTQWKISNLMRKYGIKTREKTWKLSLFRNKYQENQFLFDKINPISAWMLGLLLSDGFLHSKWSKYFGIRLKLEDKDVVIKLKKALSYSGPIYYSRSKSCITSRNILINDSGGVRLQIYNTYIVDKLKSLGINENKSLHEKFLTCIKNENKEAIFSSFIRGIYEGDGSILFDKKMRSLCFQIVGTKELLLEIQKYLIIYCKVKKTKLTNNIKAKNHYALRYRGNNQAIRIFEWLYKNTKKMNRMDRKYNKFLAIKTELIKNEGYNSCRRIRQAPLSPYFSQ